MEDITLNTRLSGNEKNWVFIGKDLWHQDHTGIIYPPVWLYPNFDRGRDKIPNGYAHELAREDFAFVSQSLSDTDISVEYKCPYGSVIVGGIVFRAQDSSSFYAVDVVDRGRKGHFYEIVLSVQEKNGYRRELARAQAQHSIVPERIVQTGPKTREDWDISSPDWIKVRVQATGTYIRVSADGINLIDVRDSRYGEGYAGLSARGAVFFQNLVIKGTKGQMQRTWEKHEGELPRFFYPGRKQNEGFNAYPAVCGAGNGVIYTVWAYTPKDQYYSQGNSVVFTRSDDNGKTWDDVRVIYDTGSSRIVCYPSAVYAHEDGSITCLIGIWEKGIIVFRSDDGGRTWEDKGEFKAGGKALEKDLGLYSPMTKLSDGRVVMTGYEAKVPEGKEASNANRLDRALLFISSDDGYTWNEPVYIDKDNYDHNECMVAEYMPGKLVAFMRTLKAPNMWISTSEDGGATWTHLRQTDVSGECPYLLKHSSGALLMANRGYGTFIKTSFDNGRTWTQEIRISPASAMIGMTEVDDGKVLIVMHEGYRVPGWIRGQFFKVTESGVAEAE